MVRLHVVVICLELKYTYHICYLDHFKVVYTRCNETQGQYFRNGFLMQKEEKCLFVPIPTYCTITRFGFRARRIDGVECGLFSNHAPLGQTTLRVASVSLGS